MNFRRQYEKAILKIQATLDDLKRAALHRLGISQGGLVLLTEEQKAKITEWRPSFTRSHEPLADEIVKVGQVYMGKATAANFVDNFGVSHMVFSQKEVEEIMKNQRSPKLQFRNK